MAPPALANARSGAARAAAARYTETAVSTVSPAQLVCLLYDRLVADLQTAEAGFGRGAPDARVAIDHALDILTELRASLDVRKWEGGPGLARLYAFLIAELVGASIKGDVARIASCRSLVEPLRDAWHEAAAKVQGSS